MVSADQWIRLQRVLDMLRVYQGCLQEALARVPQTWREEEDQRVLLTVLVRLTLEAVSEVLPHEVQAAVREVLRGYEVLWSRWPVGSQSGQEGRDEQS